MRSHHPPGHWIAVAVVLAFALLTLSNLYGQRRDADATFQGRPAMAGAQGGVGAAAGPPQGGVGPQGTEGAERIIGQPPLQTRPGVEVEPPPDMAADRSDGFRKPEDAVRDKDKSMTPKKDSGMAKEEKSATKKAKRAAKGTADRSRHGVSPIDSSAPPAGN
jgi:hypothetical protein